MSAERLHALGQHLLAAAAIAGIIVLWELICRWGEVPVWLLPAPSMIVVAFQEWQHLLPMHLAATAYAVIGGFLLAVATGVPIAILIVYSPFLRRVLFPFLLVLQSALASATPPVQRDIFGNVICVEGSTGQSPARGGHDGGHVPDCCMLACAAAIQAAADLPAAIAWPAPKMAGEAASYPRLDAPTTQDRRTPANPRAPPAAA